MKMRTHEEFMNEMQGSHDCKECHGKIFGVSVDALGNTYCGYCGEQVNYPRPTKEELKNWMR